MTENNLLNIEGKESGSPISDNINVLNSTPIIRRVLAFIFDNIILAMLYLFIINFLGNAFLLLIISEQILIIIFLYLLFFIHQFYFFIFELVWNGRTFGKWLLSIKVVNRYGNKIDSVNVLIRNFSRAIYFLPPFFFLPDLICLLLTSFKSRLGDLAASSIIVKN